MKIKQVLAAAALSVAAQSASAFLVIGDSVSATRFSWPQVMREQYGSWIRSDVQSMRALVSYDYPDDLIGVDGHGDLAVLALGFNDGTYAAHGLITPEDYRIALGQTVKKLHAGVHGYKRVMIVIPPDTPASTEQHDETRYQAQLMCAIWDYYNVDWIRCVDFNDIGYYDNTSDTVHPTKAFSQEIAAFMYNEIEQFKAETPDL